MFPDVKSAKWVRGYELELTFADGVSGRLDFGPWVLGAGGVFEQLEDPSFFARVAVDAELGTVVWPNGADFDPEVLYSRLTGRPIEGQTAASHTGGS